MSGLSDLSPFGRNNGLRTTQPRRKRPCRECGREYEATLRLPRCGDCHQRRMRRLQHDEETL